MFLQTLILENIRSYEHATVEFPEGSVMLSGDIGSGKSSLLLAIEFALFGAKKGELPASLLLRHGAQTGSVLLRFLLDGKTYEIKRSLKRTRGSIKQTEGYLAVNGIKKRMMPEELRAAIIKLLGYPEEEMKKSKDMIYRFTVYTPQELMKQILYESAEQRKETLRKVFGIEKYKYIQEHGELLRRILRAKLRGYQTFIQDLPQLQEQHTQTKQTLEQAQKHLTQAREEEKQQEAIVKQAQEAKEAAEQAWHALLKEEENLKLLQQQQHHALEQLTKHKQELQSLEKKQEELAQQLQQLTLQPPTMNKEVLQAKRDALVRKHEQHQQQIKELQQRMNEKAKAIEQLKQEINLTKKILKEQQPPKAMTKEKVIMLEEEYKKIEETYQTLLKEKAVYEATLREDENILKNIASYEVCPFCKQTITEAHKQQMKQEYEEKQSQATKALQEVEQKINEFQEALKIKKQAMEEAKKALLQWEHWQKQQAQRALLEQQLHEKEQLQKNAEEEKQAIEHQLQELLKKDWEEEKAALQEIDRMLEQHKQWEVQEHQKRLIQQQLKEIKEKQNTLQEEKRQIAQTINELVPRIAELEEQVKEKSAKEQAWQQAKQLYEQAWQLLQEKSKQTAAAEQQTAHYQTVLKQLHEQIKEKEQLKQRMQKIESFNDWMEKVFLPLMEIMEKQVMTTIYTEFNELFQEWFTMLIEDETMQVRLDEDFQPLIEQNGYETTVENLSGGERQALALAYRLALNKVINDVVSHVKTKDLLILDEPTDGFSSQQMDKIRDVLEEVGVKQIILVSHEPKLESYVNHIIRVVKEGHQSKVIMNW